MKKEFLEPIRGEGIMSKKTVEAIFSNVEVIQKLNQDLHDKIESKMRHWSDKSTIGSLFVDFAPSLKLYRHYCGNHNNALELYNQKWEKSTKFYNFVEVRNI